MKRKAVHDKSSNPFGQFNLLFDRIPFREPMDDLSIVFLNRWGTAKFGAMNWTAKNISCKEIAENAKRR
ncbi:MAG TPA: hypothetical protein PLR06_08470 [Cyclobacteriaceae bacterium]|nr:hypothetical protein [Cyclobacteriaceae bacterium]